MGDMTQSSLVEDLKNSLHNLDQYFKEPKDQDYKRFLDQAALDMSRVRQRRLRTSITLVADVTLYPAPADIVRVTRTDWGRAERKARQPWMSNFPQYLPSLCLVEDGTTPQLELSRAVSASELADIGAECIYYYETRHVIGALATDTTIKPADRALLILRAQAEACTELSFRNLGKPVKIRDGVSGQPRNGTPAGLSDQLMKRWEVCARGCR